MFPKNLEATIEKQKSITTKEVAAKLENDEKARQILKRFNEAKKERAQFNSIWQEVADYVLPYRGGFYEMADTGECIALRDKNPEIYDDTGTNALVKSASALYSYTANPATRWFYFTLAPADSNGLKNISKKKASPKASRLALLNILKNGEVKRWLEETTDIVSSYINRNTSSTFHCTCQEWLAFAESGCIVLEDYSSKVLTFHPISVKDMFILNAADGSVGEVYRVCRMTNEQAYATFGEQVGRIVKNEIVNSSLKKRVYIHAIIPRAVRDPKKKDVFNMPIASYWIDYQSKELVLESGYEEMPCGVGRLNVPPGYTHGFSPAMNIRHTMASLNKLCKQRLTAGDMALTPPLNVPLDTYTNPIALKPAALNYYDPDAGSLASPINATGSFQIALDSITDAREQVRQGMMIDLIEQTDKDNTYQAMQEQLLQLKLMSPWQGNLERDYFSPIVRRVFNILYRRGGILPDVPAILVEAIKAGTVSMNIEYCSPLAKAQKHFSVTAIEQVVAMAGGLAQFGAIDIVNVEEIVRLYTELIGAPTKVLKTEEQLAEERQAQAQMKMQQQQMAMQMAQMQQLQQGAQAARDMSQAQSNEAATTQMMQGGA